jgi:hypothetical protein
MFEDSPITGSRGSDESQEDSSKLQVAKSF